MSYSRYVYEKTPLPDGRSLVVYAYSGDLKAIPDEEYCRNVELIDSDGAIAWKIAAHPQNDTNIVGVIVKGDSVEVVNFGGMAFGLNLDNGKITMLDWRK